MAPPAWVARGDAYTQPVLKDSGRFHPEASLAMGDESFDTAVADFKPRDYERELADTEKRLLELRHECALETDPKVRPDLAILIESRLKPIASMRLERQELALIRIATPAEAARTRTACRARPLPAITAS